MTSTETPLHPFANSKSRIEIIPSESRIDIEEEARIYDAMCYNVCLPAHVLCELTSNLLSRKTRMKTDLNTPQRQHRK